MSLSKGSYAGQAEILRAAQKDESYISQMNEITSNLMLFGGRKFWLKYANYHFIFSSLLYYACTTFSYLQTLGEEYTGIVPIDKASLKLLSLKKMLLYVVLLSGGHAILMILVVFLENLTTKFAHESLNPTLLRSILMVFKNLIPYMERFNKTIFYFNGSYYSLVNRFLGVKHVLFQSWLKDEASLYGFKILAGVSFINLTASFLHSYSNWSATEIDVKLPEVKEDVLLLSQNTCKLCLNSRKNTSITPCGHLFCWDCIMEWLHFRKDCPLCKGPVTISRVTFLHNYDQVRST